MHRHGFGDEGEILV
jgi:hypothetical protein